MRIVAVFALCLISGCIVSAAPSAMELLKRDLKGAIESPSVAEIRYCPDNTCEIFRAGAQNTWLPTFVYLHLFHESGYIYLSEPIGPNKPFRKVAKEEPAIRASANQYCAEQTKTPACILRGMRAALKIEECRGGYDEGMYCEACGEKERSCKEL